MERKAKIVIIEDEDRFRSMVAAGIQEVLDVEVDTFDSGKTALAALKKGIPPEVILIDLEFPDSYGIDIIKEMRQSPELENVQVMVLTGHADPKVQIEAFEAGADDFIEKGEPFEIILARIKTKIRNAMIAERLQQAAEKTDRFATAVLTVLNQRIDNVVDKSTACIADPDNQEAIGNLRDSASSLGKFASTILESGFTKR